MRSALYSIDDDDCSKIGGKIHQFVSDMEMANEYFTLDCG